MALIVTPSRKSADMVCAILLIAAAGGLYIAAGHYSPASAAFPRVLSLLLACCGALLVLRASTQPAASCAPLWQRPARVMMGFLLVFGYIVAIDHSGYIAASLLFGVGLPTLCGYRQWRVTLPVIIGALCFIIIVFRWLLERPLPQGLAETLLERIR